MPSLTNCVKGLSWFDIRGIRTLLIRILRTTSQEFGNIQIVVGSPATEVVPYWL